MEYIVQNPTTKANIQSFMRHARILAENKIFFNKPYAKKLNPMEACFEVSRQMLGKDFMFLQDAISTRLYIRDVFGANSLRYFENSEGEIVLDIEHALLFYYKLKSMNSNLLNVALGVVYFIAGHQIDDEFTQISKVSPKNVITPSFRLDATLFSWKRCNYILRKYMLQMSAQEGYNAYYFERPLLNQIAYLTYHGETFESASKQIEQMQGGIFYTFLPTHVESMLIPSILSGGFNETIMDGYYTQTYLRDKKTIEQTYTLDDVYNVYNQMLKPVLIEMMGMIVNNVIEEAERNAYMHPNEFRIYNISQHRLGVLVKQGINIQNVLPTLYSRFKQVETFDLTKLLEGEHL